MAGNPLQFGVRIRGDDFVKAVELAQRADRLGFHRVVFGDQASGPTLEGWTLATAIAAKTERMRLMHATLNLPWRYPPFLVKMAASLDVVSGGRLDLCLGAGGTLPFLLEDYKTYGVELGTAGQRYTAVRDFIRMARGMWANDKFSYEGAAFQVKEAVCLPKPVHGTVPLWVGAGRPRMLRLIGRMADGWMRNRGWPESLDEYRAMNATIDEAAVTAGRLPSAVRRVLNGGAVVAASEAKAREATQAAGGLEAAQTRGVAGTPAQVAQQVRDIAAAGADAFTFTFPDVPSMELFAGEVMPTLRQGA